MLDLANDIRSLSDFKRKTSEFLVPHTNVCTILE